MKHAAEVEPPASVRHPVHPERVPDLRGRLGMIGLIELLQLVELGGHDALLELADREKPVGEVHLCGGTVAGARHQHLTGAEALLALLRQKTGDFALYAERDQRVEPELSEFKIGPLLLEFIRLEDELVRYADTQFSPEQPVSLVAGGVPGGDPVGEGLGLILAAIREKPGITQQRLAATLPLAPQRVVLAIAWLNACGRLEQAARPRPSAQFGAITAAWLSRLMDWKQGKLRLLVACPAGVSAKELEQGVLALQRALKAAPFSFESAMTGPSFVRLRPAVGGVLALTFLSVSRKHRFLFQTFAQGVDLVLVPGDLDQATRDDLLPGVAGDRILLLPSPQCPGDLFGVLKGFAERQFSLSPSR